MSVSQSNVCMDVCLTVKFRAVCVCMYISQSNVCMYVGPCMYTISQNKMCVRMWDYHVWIYASPSNLSICVRLGLCVYMSHMYVGLSYVYKYMPHSRIWVCMCMALS